MNIDGWAFKKNESEGRQANRDRYAQIKHLKTSEHMSWGKTPKYGKGVFSGRLLSDEAKSLSEKDIAILMDDGNLCFGGYCNKMPDGSFSGAYYTD